MAVVDIVHWNPLRPVFARRWGRFFPMRARVNNFGDLLGPLIAQQLVIRAGFAFKRPMRSARLLCVGSILSLARPGDIIWGVGINGKSLAAEAPVGRLDFRSVRGPKTHAWASLRGGSVPAVFGDPGLLVPFLCDLELLKSSRRSTDYLIVPNLNDYSSYDQDDPHVLNPRSPLRQCIGAIANANSVVGSSLHALVLADAMGIPSKRIRSDREPDFKYRDYYEGAGIEYREPSLTVEDALDCAAVMSNSWTPRKIIEAFPFDLWTTDINAAVGRVLQSLATSP